MKIRSQLSEVKDDFEEETELALRSSIKSEF